MKANFLEGCKLLGRTAERAIGEFFIGKACRCPLLSLVVRCYPETAHIYRWGYLSCSFSPVTRLRSMISQYRFIDRNYAHDFINRIMNGGIPLWDRRAGATCYEISIGYEVCSAEGDLSLSMDVNGERIYTLAFGIVPGRFVGIGTPEVLFIARIQGGRDYAKIRTAIKDFDGLRPTTMLLAAARGVATASGIHCIAGVRTGNQLTLGPRLDEMGCEAFDYDRFWREVGAELIRPGEVFKVPPFPRHIPLSERKRQHRSRKNRQHEVEEELIRTTGKTFGEKCVRRRAEPE